MEQIPQLFAMTRSNMVQIFESSASLKNITSYYFTYIAHLTASCFLKNYEKLKEMQISYKFYVDSERLDARGPSSCMLVRELIKPKACQVAPTTYDLVS